MSGQQQVRITLHHDGGDVSFEGNTEHAWYCARDEARRHGIERWTIVMPDYQPGGRKPGEAAEVHLWAGSRKPPPDTKEKLWKGLQVESEEGDTMNGTDDERKERLRMYKLHERPVKFLAQAVEFGVAFSNDPLHQRVQFEVEGSARGITLTYEAITEMLHWTDVIPLWEMLLTAQVEGLTVYLDIDVLRKHGFHEGSKFSLLRRAITGEGEKPKS